MSGATTGSRTLYPSLIPNPQRWWSRLLNSEQLARNSVLDARDAARQFAASRGIDWLLYKATHNPTNPSDPQNTTPVSPTKTASNSDKDGQENTPDTPDPYTLFGL